MINPAQIPPEVVEAAAVTLMGRLMVSREDAARLWAGLYEPEKEQFRREARAAIAAALAAWPGMHKGHQCTGCGGDPQIILPIPQEASDE